MLRSNSKKTTLVGMMLMLVAVFLISVFSIAVPTFAAPPGMDEGTPYTSSKGNARFTELQNKDLGWTANEGDGRWGWIVHGYAMDGGNFKGSIEVKGMDANSGYLVTLYSQNATTAQLLGIVGYYGRMAKYDPGTPKGWADIALFKTDAQGNAKIGLPYTSPATDPVFGTLTAPMLPPGTYAGVSVGVKYVGTGAAPDWALVATGGYSVGGSPEARDYNLYEMAQLSFSISGSALLVSKTPSGAWPVIWTGAFGVLKYAPSGSTFDFEFDGHRLQANTSYSLIYYADGWPGNHPGALIATGTSNSNGDLPLSGTDDLGMDLPDPADANYPTGAKIWLVPSSNYNSSTKSMTAFNPSSYLFENNWVVYDDIDVP